MTQKQDSWALVGVIPYVCHWDFFPVGGSHQMTSNSSLRISTLAVLAYWLEQPVEKRLEALELIRREFHRWKYDAEPRLQRVFTITKLK
jgi:hypothetical protein